MGLIGECAAAMVAFQSFYFCLPVAIQMVIRGAAGLAMLFACFKLFVH